MKLPGRESVSISSFCTVRRSVWVARLSKDHCWKLQKIVEFRGQKTLKTIVKQPPTSLPCCLGGFQEKNMLASSKNKPWYSRHVLFSCECARLWRCARAMRSPSAYLVSCWSVVFGSRHSCLEIRFSCLGSGHSRSIFCHCVSARSRVRSDYAPPVHVCFVVLHAVRVFHWLRAFMLSCLVWTRGLWVFSLAVCSCPVLHMAGELFAGHVLVFCVSTWLLS